MDHLANDGFAFWRQCDKMLSMRDLTNKLNGRTIQEAEDSLEQLVLDAKLSRLRWMPGTDKKGMASKSSVLTALLLWFGSQPPVERKRILAEGHGWIASLVNLDQPLEWMTVGPGGLAIANEEPAHEVENITPRPAKKSSGKRTGA